MDHFYDGWMDGWMDGLLFRASKYQLLFTPIIKLGRAIIFFKTPIVFGRKKVIYS